MTGALCVYHRCVTLSHMAKQRQQSQEAHVTVRLPRELLNRIERRAAQEGVGRSQVIREMLDAGLRRKPSSRDQLRQVLDEVKALRREVRAVVKRKGTRE